MRNAQSVVKAIEIEDIVKRQPYKQSDAPENLIYSCVKYDFDSDAMRIRE